jgi:hypothetical protein
MIKETSRQQTYYEVEETINLNVNGKKVKVYRWNKQDDNFGDYDDETSIDGEDKEKLTEEEVEELEDFIGDNL